MQLNILLITLGGDERGSVRLRISQLLKSFSHAHPEVTFTRVDRKADRKKLLRTILCFTFRNILKREKLILIQRLVSPKWLTFFMLPLLKLLGFRIYFDVDDEVELTPAKVKVYNFFLRGVSAAYPAYPAQLGLTSIPVFFYPTPLDESISKLGGGFEKGKYTFVWIGTYVTYRKQVREIVDQLCDGQSIKIITGRLSDKNRSELSSLSNKLDIVTIDDWLDSDRIANELREATYGLHMSRHHERPGGMSYKVIHYIQAGILPVEIGERDPALIHISDVYKLHTLKVPSVESLSSISEQAAKDHEKLMQENAINIEEMRVAHFVEPLLEFWRQ